jgi:hypothetical protein
LEIYFQAAARVKLGGSGPERAEKVVKGVVGKRLTYRRTRQHPQEAA